MKVTVTRTRLGPGVAVPEWQATHPFSCRGDRPTRRTSSVADGLIPGAIGQQARLGLACMLVLIDHRKD